MPGEPRRVPAATARAIAVTSLGRLACMYADPKRDGHDHDLCVRDDESYAADQMLGLLAAVTDGDEDLALDRLQDLLTGIKHPE